MLRRGGKFCIQCIPWKGVLTIVCQRSETWNWRRKMPSGDNVDYWAWHLKKKSFHFHRCVCRLLYNNRIGGSVLWQIIAGSSPLCRQNVAANARVVMMKVLEPSQERQKNAGKVEISFHFHLRPVKCVGVHLEFSFRMLTNTEIREVSGYPFVRCRGLPCM